MTFLLFILTSSAFAFNVRRHTEAIEATEAKENSEVRDILLTVKTTAKNHKTRVKLLLDTWSQEALQNVRFHHF